MWEIALMLVTLAQVSAGIALFGAVAVLVAFTIMKGK